MAAVISSSVLTPNRYSFLERVNGTRANIESGTTIGGRLSTRAWAIRNSPAHPCG